MSHVDSTEISSSDDNDMWELLDSLDIKEQKNKNECPQCKNTDIVCDYSKGVKRCDNCGATFGKVLDNRAEWSMYDDGSNEGVARCGHATSFYFPQSSMRTPVSGSKNSSIRIMQQWDAMPYNEYSLYLSFQIIIERCSRNGLPQSVIDNTKILYKAVTEKRVIIRGKKKKPGIYGACTFYGCQMQGCYRTTEEIASMYNVTTDVITTACNRLRKILIDNPILNSLPPIAPEIFIARYCYKLGLVKDQIDMIIKIAKNNSKLFLTSNHQPMSVGATCVLLYLHIFNLSIPTTKQVLKVFNITNVTTDKIFNKMLPFCNVLIDDKVTDMILNKLIASKYIAVESSFQSKMTNNVTKLRDEMIEDNKEWLK